MMTKTELRIGNLLNYTFEGVTHETVIDSQDLKWIEASEDDFNMLHEPIPLTKEKAKEIGFEVTDMGDYWEFEKGDFILMQFKIPIVNKVLEPVFILYSKEAKHIKVKYVHKAQNLYYELKGEELIVNKL